MYAVVVCLAFLGQTDPAVPPAPAPAESLSKPATPQRTQLPAYPLSNSMEDMKAWLLARLVVDYSFDANKASEVSRMMDTMNEGQMRLLIAAYRDRMATQPELPKQEVENRQRQILEQANQNKQTAEAYRDQLKRDFDTQAVQNQMMQNQLYQNMLNLQMMNYSTAPFTTSYVGYPFSYGYGYPGFNPGLYSVYGYGIPAYGSSMFYAGPAYGTSMIYTNGPAYGVGVGLF